MNKQTKGAVRKHSARVFDKAHLATGFKFNSAEKVRPGNGVGRGVRGSQTSDYEFVNFLSAF